MTKDISVDAAKAFIAGKKFARTNTTVATTDNTVTLLLHGNVIAKRRIDSSLATIVFSLCGWNTPTTRDRLNAILNQLQYGEKIDVDIAFVQRKYQPAILIKSTQVYKFIDANAVFNINGDKVL